MSGLGLFLSFMQSVPYIPTSAFPLALTGTCSYGYTNATMMTLPRCPIYSRWITWIKTTQIRRKRERHHLSRQDAARLSSHTLLVYPSLQTNDNTVSSSLSVREYLLLQALSNISPSLPFGNDTHNTSPPTTLVATAPSISSSPQRRIHDLPTYKLVVWISTSNISNFAHSQQHVGRDCSLSR